MREKGCKETWEEAPQPVGEPASCLKIVKQIGVDGVCSLKCIHLHKRALSSSLQSITAPLAPPQSGTEPLPTRVIARSTRRRIHDQAAKAAMSVS